MIGNNVNCSIKGCNYKARWRTKILDDNRQYNICPKHKPLIINPFNWVKID